MKTDRYRLERILEIGDQLQSVIQRRGITADDVQNDVEVQWLITTPLFNIGEQANCLSPEFVAEHPDVPWVQVAGLRHRLVHHYEGTNWRLVSNVLFNDLGQLINQVREILEASQDEADQADEAVKAGKEQ